MGPFLPRDLQRIREWQKRTSPAWATRYVSESAFRQALDLIRFSRVRAAVWGALIVAVVVALVASAIFSYRAAVRAEEAQRISEDALVKGFHRTIGIDTESNTPSREEREALWDLATLESPNVRHRLVDIWLESPDAYQHAETRDGMGLRAVGELDPAIRGKSGSELLPWPQLRFVLLKQLKQQLLVFEPRAFT